MAKDRRNARCKRQSFQSRQAEHEKIPPTIDHPHRWWWRRRRRFRKRITRHVQLATETFLTLFHCTEFPPLFCSQDRRFSCSLNKQPSYATRWRRDSSTKTPPLIWPNDSFSPRWNFNWNVFRLSEINSLHEQVTIHTSAFFLSRSKHIFPLLSLFIEGKKHTHTHAIHLESN